MIGYLIIASISATFGLVIAGAMASSKVNDLHRRLATAEEDLVRHKRVTDELVLAVDELLSIVDDPSDCRTKPEALANIRAVLRNAEPLLQDGSFPGASPR